MSQFLPLFVLLPLAGFLLSLLVPRKNETAMAVLSIATIGAQLLGVIVFAVYWLVSGYPALDLESLVIYETAGFEFFISFYYDKVTAVYSFIGSVLALIVAFFSRYYIHRESGFKRFFNTILFFFLGYNIVIFSGNFETLFIGWEFVGISSFLLIAFYRDRYLPVKNSLKVISVYRLGDICLMLAMWMWHHVWHKNITFAEVSDAAGVRAQLAEHYWPVFFIIIMIFVAAATKSAQLPFSSWLPRAMEGPTSSSAIFYGSLSVHLGVFLLLRTYPFWENMPAMKITLVVVGLITSLVAASIARVQSTVKTQIAYSSVAQIGIIFIEVALGFHELALVHFAGHAFLRTYQLLVSPSVLSYLVHDQVFNFVPRDKDKKYPFQKLRHSLYVLSIKEWNIDTFLNRALWNPFKRIGTTLGSLSGKLSLSVVAAAYLFGLYDFVFEKSIPENVSKELPVIFALVGLLLVLKSFAERGSAIRGWVLVLCGQFFIALTIALNEHVGADQLILFFSGILVSAVAGFICLNKMKQLETDIDLNRFHGHVYEHPKLALIFLLSCLGILGFPVTAAFVGVDLFLTHIHPDQYVLITLVILSVAFIELSVLRMYARIFLGQHKKPYHPVAFKSS
ncbi:MAG: NADH dehydrogenase (quinone) [Bacteroidetes bacterium]|nr:MAG: NADH dehydrogenase (quinone) [Bacteroidota bacterium]